MQYAKANPGKLTYSSPGNGTPQHLAGEVFAQHDEDAAACTCPYRGTGPAIADVIGGQVQMSFGTMASVMPFIAGRQAARARHRRADASRPRCRSCRPSARSASRATKRRSGTACWRRPRRRKPVVDKLNAALVQALKIAAGRRSSLAKQGFETRSSTPAELKAAASSRTWLRWARVISELKLKIEQ